MGENQPRRGFLRGALVLTAGMAVVKLLGALFKVPLNAVIGEYGIGLFNLAYHYFGPVFSLASAGFPVAVSRLVAEDASLGRWRDVRQVRRAAMPLFCAFGVAGAGAMACLSPLYCQRVPGAAFALWPMLALAPAVALSSAASVYRGWAEGLGDMAPTAVSQVAEAALKLLLGLGLARWAVLWSSREYAARGVVLGAVPATGDEARFLILSLGAAGALLGVTAGSLASLAYLALAARLRPASRLPRRGPAPRGLGATARRLGKLTAPIALGSLVASAGGLLDATLAQDRLAAALSRQPGRFLAALGDALPAACRENPSTIPTYLTGCFSLAATVYLLVPGVTQALGSSALPGVTGMWARGGPLVPRLESVLRAAAVFCCPAGLSLSVLGEPAARLLYGDSPSTPLVGRALGLLGLAALPAALCGPLSSLLQGVGRGDLPARLLLPAMALRLGATWALCAIPEVNVLGTALSAGLCYGCLCLLQWRALGRAAKGRLSWRRVLGPPLVGGLLCAAAAGWVFRLVSPLLGAGRFGMFCGLCTSGLAGAAVYGGALFLMGAFPGKFAPFARNRQKVPKTLEKPGGI